MSGVIEKIVKTVRKVPCEIYSRVVGYFRPVANWNVGKQAEFGDRVTYSATKSLDSAERRATRDVAEGGDKAA